MQVALMNYIKNPTASWANRAMGLEYDKIGQTGSALAYYLRSAERAASDLEQYECLLLCGLCLAKQRLRDDSTKVIFLKAISLMPERGEAYFYLSRHFERQSEWQDSYTIASLGLRLADPSLKPLPTLTEYPGYYSILFQKGVAAWWCAHCDESVRIMRDLRDNYVLAPQFKTAVERNISVTDK